MKKKVMFPFESPREQYKTEATVVWCTDDRFSLSLQVFRERMGWRFMDLIRVEGGARDLGTFGEDNARHYLLGQIGKSIELHHSPEIFLMMHYNCNALGREQLEPSDEEDRFFAAELAAAKKSVEQYLALSGGTAKIRLILCDFKNVYELEA